MKQAASATEAEVRQEDVVVTEVEEHREAAVERLAEDEAGWAQKADRKS